MKNKKSLHAFMPFDWDRNKKSKEEKITPEELEKLTIGINKAMKIFNENKNKKRKK